MKEFFTNFIIIFIILAVTVFFFGGLIFNSIWAMVAFISFIIAIFLTGYMSQEDRIEFLEKKLEETVATRTEGGTDEREE